MDAAFISAVSALAGSVVGGLTSGLTNWLNQRAQVRAGLVTHSLSRREDLFRDFMIIASKAYGEALVSSDPKIEELVQLYGMISRMRAMSSAQTVACAEKVMIETIAAYSVPNKTIPEVHDLLKSGTRIDPLKDFAEAVRTELRMLGSLRIT
jgi:hypothetical protein